jgi:hypothetical protein
MTTITQGGLYTRKDDEALLIGIRQIAGSASGWLFVEVERAKVIQGYVGDVVPYTPPKPKRKLWPALMKYEVIDDYYVTAQLFESTDLALKEVGQGFIRLLDRPEDKENWPMVEVDP